MKIKKSLFGFAMLIGFFALAFGFSITLEKRKFKMLEAEFPEISFYDTISGRVSNLYNRRFGMYTPGEVYISIENLGNVRIYTDYYNLPDDEILDRIIKVGDFVLVDQKNDSIHVFHCSKNMILEKKASYALRISP